ncbi:MAG: beta-galactosidase GalA [Chitinophagaceae bacterium]
MMYRSNLILLVCLFCSFLSSAQSSSRQKWLMDPDWKFSFGHPYDYIKDFSTNTSYFSYLAKAGYGDGAAKANFDDRAWRKINLPHDWAVEQNFDEKASFSHGFKAIGRPFPERTIGWYRKSFFIPKEDTSKRIKLIFDGVFRHSAVWVNGHYLGTAESGYTGFTYDVSEVLNYGDSNIVAVRVDAGIEEGWYYEGAGIYRHVWLTKTAPVHVPENGTFVHSTIYTSTAEVFSESAITNESLVMQSAEAYQFIQNKNGDTIARSPVQQVLLRPFQEKKIYHKFTVSQPKLWSVDSPHLYKLITVITQDGKLLDQQETRFGIRQIRFDAKQGFFLNGKQVKLKGTNNHQDHAGVGTAIPDELQYWRIRQLKEMGSNAYRCAHHPPTPELLNACDELGMLVIDENRLMQTTAQGKEMIRKMIMRDRNHPSVISWSIGNEEWAIENNTTGERIARNLQAFVQTIDSTRQVTAGISGGFRSGISSVLQVMGYNYMGNGDIDAHAKAFPLQPGMGTEEGSTFATRGVYVEDKVRHYQPAYDRKPRPSFYSIEEGWQFYANRPNLAGIFIWTGFDYRGEPTPYGFPSVTSYFGMMDLCGFPKDNVYYLRSWWTQQPVLHILPHWNWTGREGEEIEVVVYSNAEEVELSLNRKSLGRKKMPLNGHLKWMVKYTPGALEAIAYRNGKKLQTAKVNTTAKPHRIHLAPHKNTITADGEDLLIVTASATDEKGQPVPIANNELQFELTGPAKIIGVGNGDPTSLEKEQFIDKIETAGIDLTFEKPLTDTNIIASLLSSSTTENWIPAFKQRDYNNLARLYIHRGSFTIPQDEADVQRSLYYKCIGQDQSVYINGKLIAADLPYTPTGYIFDLAAAVIHPGNNRIDIVATPIPKKNPWDEVNMDAGLIRLFTPSAPWKRKLFNGLAQIIIRAEKSTGTIELKASSGGLQPAVLTVRSTEDPIKRYLK